MAATKPVQRCTRCHKEIEGPGYVVGIRKEGNDFPNELACGACRDTVNAERKDRQGSTTTPRRQGVELCEVQNSHLTHSSALASVPQSNHTTPVVSGVV